MTNIARARAERDLIVRCPDPLNAETPGAVLAASFLTPQRGFYIRSHGAIPALPADHAVTITGLVGHSRSFTPAELRDGFATRTVVATMQCAGNRRAHLQNVAPTSGDPWDVGAIGNAEWTGAALSDVLAELSAGPGARYVNATGADVVDVDGEAAPFGISIPLAKALGGEVLIAWAMNGEPLAPEHGAPLRLVVPGYAGVRSAKWLTRIELADRPSDAPIQARDYKLFPASVQKSEADWDKGLTIDEMPLNSAICTPGDGARLRPGHCTLAGYATASGRPIARVEVSTDGGRHWTEAELDRHPDAPWSWTQWRLPVDLAPGRHELMVRAVDGAGQMQPETPDAIWNFAGYLSAAWHRIAVEVA